jgi:hypothetical protein
MPRRERLPLNLSQASSANRLAVPPRPEDPRRPSSWLGGGASAEYTTSRLFTGELLALQGLAGNQAVGALIPPSIQREVVRERNERPRDIVLDERSPIAVRASVVYDYLEQHHGGSPFTFAELKSLVASDPTLVNALRTGVTATLRDYALHVLQLERPAVQTVHEDFLREFSELEDEAFKLLPLLDHALAATYRDFAHYSRLDHLFENRQLIWRFTSTPSAEVVFVDANVSPREVVEIIAKHSGGADKSNPNVITLSFGRNLGALFGTAMSAGGDPHVLNIIDKAAYLYGIDISSLASHGITAHPAVGRAISLYETEYVLVGTPGMPATTLEALAEVRVQNPFLGRAITISDTAKFKTLQSMKRIEHEMGVKAVEARHLRSLPTGIADAIIEEARAIAGVATHFQESIQNPMFIYKSHAEVTIDSAMAELGRFRALLPKVTNQAGLTPTGK